MTVVVPLGEIKGGLVEIQHDVLMDVAAFKEQIIGKPITLDLGGDPAGVIAFNEKAPSGRPVIGHVLNAYTKEGRLMIEADMLMGSIPW